MNYKNIIFKSGFLVFLFLISLSFTSLASADSTCSCVDKSLLIEWCGLNNDICINSCGGVMMYKSCAQNPPVVAPVTPPPPDVSKVTPQELPNPLGKGVTVELMIARIINFVLSLVGSISLLMFIYGGLTWMTSAGSQEKVKKGREIIVWAIIGLAVVFFSYLLVRFVISGLTG